MRQQTAHQQKLQAAFDYAAGRISADEYQQRIQKADLQQAEIMRELFDSGYPVSSSYSPWQLD